MKKIVSLITKSIVGLVAITFLVACGDGVHPAGPSLGLSVSGMQPKINKFLISKADGSGSGATSVTIEQGDSVMLEWEVVTEAVEEEKDEEEGDVGAKSAKAADDEEEAEGEEETEKPTVTIDCAQLGLHFENLEASGSTVVENVKVDKAVFIITASYGGKTVSSEATAMVNKETEAMTANLTVNGSSSATVDTDESVRICFDVSRSDATVSVTDSKGNTVYPTQDAVTLPDDSFESEVMEESGDESDELTVTGKAVYLDEEATLTSGGSAPGKTDCFDVTAEEGTTTYQLTATAGSEMVKQEVTVTAETKLKIVEFDVTSENIEGETVVTIKWEVSPEEATVSITGIGEDLENKGEEQISISETTAFEIVAELDGKEATDEATIEIERPTEVALKASGSQTIFAGDSAEISWNVVDGNGAPVSDATVLVKGGDYGEAGSEQAASGSLSVSPTTTTEYTLEVVGSNIPSVLPMKVKISVREWVGPHADSINVDSTSSTTRAITSLGISEEMTFAGFEGNFAGGNIILAKGTGSSWSNVTLPFMATIPALDSQGGSNNAGFFDDFEYPINAVVVDPANPNRIYAATTGAVFYSDDAGDSWTFLVGFLLDDSMPLPHPTCNGKELAGWPGEKIHGLGQACDIEISESGRFFIATDMYVEYLPEGVDAHMADRKAGNWKGIDTIAYGLVNNDLEIGKIDGAETLFVGTSSGVLMSSDMGDSYTNISGTGGPTGQVYAVAVDSQNKKLYAGADGQVYTCELSGSGCASWSNQILGSDGSAKVYGITVDPVQSGGVFAATGKGVFYSADGTTWKDVTSGAMESGVKVTSIASAKSEDGTRGVVYAGTSQGMFVSEVDIVSGSDTNETTGEEVTGVEAPADSDSETEGEGEGTVIGDDEQSATNAMSSLVGE